MNVSKGDNIMIDLTETTTINFSWLLAEFNER